MDVVHVDKVEKEITKRKVYPERGFKRFITIFHRIGKI